MTERIMTLHPEGKAGVNIDKTKYDIEPLPKRSPQQLRLGKAHA